VLTVWVSENVCGEVHRSPLSVARSVEDEEHDDGLEYRLADNGVMPPVQ